jgi:predicted glutamine amidotransferase
MHNGSLAGFPEVKPDLLMAVDASLYPHIEASTDTETLFFLALTFGLTDDPHRGGSRGRSSRAAEAQRLRPPRAVADRGVERARRRQRRLARGGALHVLGHLGRRPAEE